MNRTEFACYALIGSAFVLAGLLLFSAQSTDNTAEASLVVNRDNFTVMTARTANDEEALFVLDSLSERLMIYTQDIARKRLELVAAESVPRLFQQANLGGGSGGGNDRPSR